VVPGALRNIDLLSLLADSIRIGDDGTLPARAIVLLWGGYIFLKGKTEVLSVATPDRLSGEPLQAYDRSILPLRQIYTILRD